MTDYSRNNPVYELVCRICGTYVYGERIVLFQRLVRSHELDTRHHSWANSIDDLSNDDWERIAGKMLPTKSEVE